MKKTIKYSLLCTIILLLHSSATEGCLFKGVVDRIEDMGQAVVLLEKEKRELIVDHMNFSVAEGDVVGISCIEVSHYRTRSKLSTTE